MSYRPPGWEPFNSEDEIDEMPKGRMQNQFLVDNQVYEAGAEVLLEKFRNGKRWHISRGKTELILTIETDVNGVLVFIPDDKEVKKCLNKSNALNQIRRR